MAIIAILAILATLREQESAVSEVEKINDRPRVPLTRFHNNTGEFLDLATKKPVVLTSHGRDRHIIADSDYFHRIEQAARGNIAEYMNIEAVSSSDMDENDESAFENARPSRSELENDHWED